MSTNGQDPDRAEDPHWGLVIPFVVCTSQGGPYDDEAFTAGYQAGRIDAHLRHAATAGADALTVTARTALLPLLELLAMHHGYPVLTADPIGETPHYPAMPDWAVIRFHRPPRDAPP